MDEIEKSHASADTEALGGTYPGTSAIPSQAVKAPPRIRLRQQKLQLTFIGYVVVLSMFTALQVLGVWFFTLGFTRYSRVYSQHGGRR